MVLAKGHALEFSVKVGLLGGRGNVAVLTHELTSTYFLPQLLQELFKSEKYNAISHILLYRLCNNISSGISSNLFLFWS